MSSKSSRPGGRSARVVESVLRAALEELAVTGWPRFQIEAVAARAGVHKTTVYRRWPTRGTLLAAALAATPFRALSGGTVPNTGSLPADLEMLLDDMTKVWAVERTRRIATTLFAARHDPEVEPAFAGYWEVQVGRIVTVVQQAIQRGEIAPSVDPRFVAELFNGTALLHIVELGEDVGQNWARQLTQAVLRFVGHPEGANLD